MFVSTEVAPYVPSTPALGIKPSRDESLRIGGWEHEGFLWLILPPWGVSATMKSTLFLAPPHLWPAAATFDTSSLQRHVPFPPRMCLEVWLAQVRSILQAQRAQLHLFYLDFPSVNPHEMIQSCSAGSLIFWCTAWNISQYIHLHAILSSTQAAIWNGNIFIYFVQIYMCTVHMPRYLNQFSPSPMWVLGPHIWQVLLNMSHVLS